MYMWRQKKDDFHKKQVLKWRLVGTDKENSG